MKHVNGFTRAILCGFLALSLASASAGSHRLPNAAIQPWPVAVMPSATDLASLVASMEPLTGDIVVVVIGSDFCCKEYRERMGKSPVLLAHNPLNASIEVGEWEDIELWGIVLHNLHRVSR